MKVYILEDLEGISGLGCANNKKDATEILHDEINAIITGARKGGATDIVVGDWHNMGGNLSLLKLSKPVHLTQWADKEILKKEKFDLAFFVGAHARAGLKAISAHTEEYFIKNVFVDKKPVGETTLVYYYLNDLGIPVGGIFGAKEAIDEIRHISNGTKFVVTKHDFECHPVKETQSKIEQAALLAVRDREAELVHSEPVEVIVECTNDIFQPIDSSISKIDPNSIKISGKIGHCYDILMQLL